MNKLLIIIAAICLTACAPQYTQVYQTKSVGGKLNADSLIVFENDSVRIEYNFWAQRGYVSFSIYNKMSTPIYIDWKKCSYISEGEKFDYWIDEETTNSTSYYKGYNISSPTYKASVSRGQIESNSVKSKPERITFLPPKSKCYKEKFYIYNGMGTKLHLDRDFIEVNRYDKPKRKTKIYYAEYDRENSQTVFRNYLTFSTNEKFDNEFHTDNEFYIAEILEMNRLQFNTEYQKPSNFYVNIEAMNSIEMRKKFHEP